MVEERESYISQRALSNKLKISIKTIQNYHDRGIIEPSMRFGWFILFDPIEVATTLSDQGLSESVRNKAQRFLSTQTV